MAQFHEWPEVVTRLKPFRPKLPRKITAPLLVSPRTKRYALVGTAFDYLIRFELERRAPHCVTRKWMAAYAPARIWSVSPDGRTAIGRDFFRGLTTPEQYRAPEEIVVIARKFLADAREAVQTHLARTDPTSLEFAELARHSIRLAHLESIPRADSLSPNFTEIDPDDVEDLLAMLTVVPFDQLFHEKTMLLNPGFDLINGLDLDLIAGDCLIDFKTTKEDSILAKTLDQMLVYFAACRIQRGKDGVFPPINRIGLYFCRRGYLHLMDASLWTDRPEFAEFERWFADYIERMLPVGEPN